MIGAQLKDKVLKCAHCGHQVDVPDEHEVRRVEERSLGGGGFVRVETIERRRDLHPGAANSPLPPEITRLLDGKSVDLPEGMKLDRMHSPESAGTEIKLVLTGGRAIVFLVIVIVALVVLVLFFRTMQ